MTEVRPLLPSTAAPSDGERFEPLLAHRGVIIEQILSSASPGSAAYDQPHAEWVLLLDGRATLEIDGHPVELSPGDHVFLPAHTPHRVRSTDHGTRWLAVHLPHEPGIAPGTDVGG